MKAVRRIAIVGPGRLGTALARALRRPGYTIDSLVVRRGSKSARRYRVLARQLRAEVATSLVGTNADLVWFCVPDSAISPAAESAAEQLDWKGKLAFHSSGALTSDELAVLRERGAKVASVHPLMTFVGRSEPSLQGVPFALEGDAAAVRAARTVVRKLGAVDFNIRKDRKAAYHAWGTFTSPLLTALLATTEQVAGLAGVGAREARRRSYPILLRTLQNYVERGAGKGFSGPIIRGDVEIIQQHLQVLRALPAARGVYHALAQAAVEYLPAKNKAELKRLLNRG